MVVRVLDFRDDKDQKKLRELYFDDKLIGIIKKKESASSDNQAILVGVFQYNLAG